MNDTNPRAELMMIQMIQQKTPLDRLAMGCSMFDFSRQLVWDSLIRDNPRMTDAELRREIFLRFYGDDFDGEHRRTIAEYLMGGK